MNSIASFHTGTPVNIVSNAGYANYPGLRPNLVTGQNPTLPRHERTITEWFNNAAFTNTPGQSNSDPIPGDAGRNLVRGPGYTNDGSFGSITSVSGPRIMQFALKLIY